VRDHQRSTARPPSVLDLRDLFEVEGHCQLGFVRFVVPGELIGRSIGASAPIA
jgi:hypothetical protein